jgi:hypothetical protein
VLSAFYRPGRVHFSLSVCICADFNFYCALSSDVCRDNYCVQLFSSIFVFFFFSIFVFLSPSFSPFIYFSHSSILASTAVHYVHGFLLHCNF